MFDVLPENCLHECHHVSAPIYHNGGAAWTSFSHDQQVTQWPLLHLDEHEIISGIAARRARECQHTAFVFLGPDGNSDVPEPEIPPVPHKWPKPIKPKPLKPKPAPPWPSLPVILTPKLIPVKHTD
eukprot:gnl/MRDRNA2_/MRDRNA2_244746_c0_seq1.p1 gnl/MRDRNA2_/MRDRNA2_244746_c0~~gnl/MRDRNA2_/MRDRNA2_244746_c0_seq1.p1  ORF type:complete len:126 (+),score=11.82 gnl/MRDRNA2_/MRDRNA2_244746_c0_seq1:56-433(+)